VYFTLPTISNFISKRPVVYSCQKLNGLVAFIIRFSRTHRVLPTSCLFILRHTASLTSLETFETNLFSTFDWHSYCYPSCYPSCYSSCCYLLLLRIVQPPHVFPTSSFPGSAGLYSNSKLVLSWTEVHNIPYTLQRRKQGWRCCRHPSALLSLDVIPRPRRSYSIFAKYHLTFLRPYHPFTLPISWRLLGHFISGSHVPDSQETFMQPTPCT